MTQKFRNSILGEPENSSVKVTKTQYYLFKDKIIKCYHKMLKIFQKKPL